MEVDRWGDLTGKVVMVTGASSGIGWEFCLDLAKAGCRIIAAARRMERLRSLCDEINGQGFAGGSGVRAVALQLDVNADGPVIEKAVKLAWDAFGRIDALVNNAGLTGPPKPALDFLEEDWNGILRTNLMGQWLVAKHVCRRMRDANLGGSVINIGSTAGVGGATPGSLVYASSKAALNTLTRVMSMELGTHNIRVNCICPGIFKSELTEELMKKSWLENVTRRSVPLKSYGTVDPALTSVVRYLIHDSSEYVSGNIFVVDAGATLPGLPIFSSL